MQRPRTSAEVAELVGGELWGPGNVPIDGLETLELSQAGHLTLIGEPALGRPGATPRPPHGPAGGPLPQRR